MESGYSPAEIYHIKEPQKIPLVVSPDEAKRLLAMAGNLKVRGEVVRLRVGDIDRAQNIIRIVQAKGRKDRHVMLSPETLDLLRQWGRCDRLVTIRACRRSGAGCSLAASQESRNPGPPATSISPVTGQFCPVAQNAGQFPAKPLLAAGIYILASKYAGLPDVGLN